MKLLTVIASARCPIRAEMTLCIWTPPRPPVRRSRGVGYCWVPFGGLAPWDKTELVEHTHLLVLIQVETATLFLFVWQAPKHDSSVKEDMWKSKSAMQSCNAICNSALKALAIWSMDKALKMWWMNHLIGVWSVCFDWNCEWWIFYLQRRALPRASTAFIDPKFIRFFRILHACTTE